MSISRRVWFRFLPDDPAEPTSTLVLTSPNRYFVDIRVIPKAANTRYDVDWAFAGTSSRNGGVGTWIHHVDNRQPLGTVVEDSGICSDVTNSPGDELEVGKMMDVDGTLRDYEEVWREVPLTSNIIAVLMVKIIDLDGEVIRMGYASRVGQFYQAVLKSNVGLSVVRMELRDQTWEVSVKIGPETNLIPDIAKLEDRLSGLTVGQELEVGGLKWTCLETSHSV